MTADVILTEAGGSVGYQIARSLHAMGLRVAICDTSDTGVTFRSRYIAGSFVCLPARDEKNFVRQVGEAVARSGAKMVIPVFHPEILSRHRSMLPEGTVLPVDSAEKLLLLDDKVSFCNLADSLGILQPRRYASVDEVERYPVVFKRSAGQGGDSVYFPKTRESLLNLAVNSKAGSYLITDEIDGTDVSVDALRWDGSFCAGAYEVIMPKAKGVSILRCSIDAPELVATARRILDGIDFRGVCGFDFRVDPEGRAWLLEANPRFSGGVASQTASGLDLPRRLYRKAMGLPDEPQKSFRAGVRTNSAGGTVDYFRRPHARANMTLPDALRCIFPFSRRTDDLSLSDPGTVFWLLRRIFRG